MWYSSPSESQDDQALWRTSMVSVVEPEPDTFVPEYTERGLNASASPEAASVPGSEYWLP